MCLCDYPVKLIQTEQGEELQTVKSGYTQVQPAAREINTSQWSYT